MSREIKFRAWYNDKFHYNIEKHHVEHHSMSGFSGDVWDFSDWLKYAVVQQYTGLKDSEGKEIYEGDILTYCNADSSEFEWVDVVDLYDGSFRNPYTYRRVKGSTISEVVGRSHGVDFKDFKIIGNINETPMQIL